MFDILLREAVVIRVLSFKFLGDRMACL